MAIRKATKEDVTLWVLSGQTLCLDCLGKIDCNAIAHCNKCQKRHRGYSSDCANYMKVQHMRHYKKDQDGTVIGV